VLVAPSDVDHAGTATEAGLTPLILAMGSLRAAGARSAGLALPVAGDPLGLAGPASFNAVALDVGEAVVVEGADLGLVPDRTGAGVVWQRMPATAAPPARDRRPDGDQA